MFNNWFFAGAFLLFLVLASAADATAASQADERSSILTALSIAALVVAVYASLVFFIVAFKESVLWGLICLLPIFTVVFLLAHWEEAKSPFFAAFLGWMIFVYGWF